jgi:hypothetical protein
MHKLTEILLVSLNEGSPLLTGPKRNLFHRKKRLKGVIFYGSLGKCALVCPDLLKVNRLAKAV